MMTKSVSGRNVELKGSSIEKDFNKINHLRERLSVPDGNVLPVYNDCLHEGKLVNIAFWDDYDLDTVYILE